MQKIISILLFMTLLVGPIVVQAEDDIEKERIAELIKQVELLTKEVERIQNIFLGYRIREAAFEPLSDSEMRHTISAGVSWFKNAQEENGRFAYEYEPYKNTYLPKDNIVRQAGGFYSLGEIALHDTENVYELKEVLHSSARYFDSLSNRGSWNGYSFRCVGNSAINETCQLGTTSLALIGLIDTVIRYPELRETYDQLINDYGRYILSMKKENTGFRHAYTDGLVPSEDESSFSNGEALLALVRFYMYEPSEEVRNVIDQTFDYFDGENVPFDFPLYLWVMAAVKDMQQLWPSDKYVDYAERYTDWRVSGFAYRKGTTHNMCAYVEGLASAYSVLEGNGEESRLAALQKEINHWLRHSRELQIDADDQYRIVHEDGESHFAKIEDMERALGGFLTDERKLTQRIDFTQHCLTSYLQQLVDINGSSL